MFGGAVWFITGCLGCKIGCMRAQIIRNLNPDLEAVEAFCRKWHIAEMCFFGSVLRDDFSEDSDVDVLITYEDGRALDLFDRACAQDELSEILGRKVDWISRGAVAWWRTPQRFRDNVFSTAEVVHTRLAHPTG